jgi:hypothetical protein
LESLAHKSPKARTSRNQFLNFLKADKPDSDPTWESLTVADFTFDNMRRFSSYLLNKTDVVESTAQNYLSSVRSQVGPLHNYQCELQALNGADAVWHRLREDLKKHYDLRKKEAIGIHPDAELTNKGAPCMSIVDYNEILFSLFKEMDSLGADVEKLSFDRNLIAHAWTLAGRPYELGTVSYSGYRMNPTDNILRGRIYRTKKFKLQTLTLPCAPLGYPYITYAIDPVHALGTYMVLGEQEGVLKEACVFRLAKEFSMSLSSVKVGNEGDASDDEDVDSEEDDEDVVDSTEANEEPGEVKKKKTRSDPFAGYITKVLAAHVPSSNKKYTSYSTRRGVLQQMGDASDTLRHADAAVRSGQINTMQANDTFYEYYMASNEHDNKAGEISKS